MKNINNFIIEKLKISADNTDNTDNDLQDLAKLWTIWKRKQKAKFPEVSLKAMYRKHHIERPSKPHPYSSTKYFLSSMTCYERTDGGCNVTLFYSPGDPQTVILNETKSYDELIEFLGGGNIKDGETIYNEIVNKLNN